MILCEKTKSCYLLLFLNTKYNTTFSISLSVTNLSVSSTCIASSFCPSFHFKICLSLSHLSDYFEQSLFLILSVSKACLILLTLLDCHRYHSLTLFNHFL